MALPVDSLPPKLAVGLVSFMPQADREVLLDESSALRECLCTFIAIDMIRGLRSRSQDTDLLVWMPPSELDNLCDELCGYFTERGAVPLQLMQDECSPLKALLMDATQFRTSMWLPALGVRYCWMVSLFFHITVAAPVEWLEGALHELGARVFGDPADKEPLLRQIELSYSGSLTDLRFVYRPTPIVPRLVVLSCALGGVRHHFSTYLPQSRVSASAPMHTASLLRVSSWNPFAAYPVAEQRWSYLPRRDILQMTFGRGVRHLDLSGLHVESVEGSFLQRCQTLESVVAPGKCHLGNIQGNFAAECPSLTFIDVANMRISNIAANFAWQCGALRSIDISGLKLTTVGACFLSHNTRLHSMTAAHKCTLGAVFHGFAKFCVTLTECQLSNMGIASISDEFLHGCSALRHVDLTGVNATTVGNKCFFGCSNLESIVGKCSLGDVGSEFAAQCFSLTAINLGSLTVRKLGALAFAHCIKLKHMDLSGVELSAVGPQFLLGCEQMELICAPRGCRLGNVGYGFATRCPRVRVEDVNLMDVHDRASFVSQLELLHATAE